MYVHTPVHARKHGRLQVSARVLLTHACRMSHDAYVCVACVGVFVCARLSSTITVKQQALKFANLHSCTTGYAHPTVKLFGLRAVAWGLVQQGS